MIVIRYCDFMIIKQYITTSKWCKFDTNWDETMYRKSEKCLSLVLLYRTHWLQLVHVWPNR